MENSKVISIRSVELGVPHLEKTADFYAIAWGLEAVEQTSDFRLLRATGLEHHVLKLSRAQSPCLQSMDFAVADAADVNELHASMLAAGQRVLAAPHERPHHYGGGYGAEFVSPDGVRICVSAGVRQHACRIDDKTRPVKLSHVVINATDVPALSAWFIDRLGFRLSDTTRTQTFLRCGSDHHTVALGHGAGLSVNHIAYEMVDIDGLMYGTGRMMDHGYASEWGLGRHGPGSNIFNYFVDPEGFAIEYTTDLEQVDDASYQAQTPEYWTAFPRRPCRWGVARKPSARLMEAFSGKGVDVYVVPPVSQVT